MDGETFAALAHSAQTVVIAAVILAAYVYFPKLKLRAQLAKLPVFKTSSGEEPSRTEYIKNGKIMYVEGYQQFRNQAYRMVDYDGTETVVISPEFLPEVRKLSTEVLSFAAAIANTMESKYTGILTELPLAVHALKADLTPALGRLNSVVYSEVVQAFETYMPACEDWTSVNIYSLLVDMIATITGSIFVGPELCRDEQYHRIAIDYSMHLVDAQVNIKKIRPLFRPFLAPRLPSVRKVHETEKLFHAFLKPIIESRINSQKNDPNWQQPDDMLGWLMARQGDSSAASIKELTQSQLGLIFASIHTTTMAATNILFTLAVTPEYIEPLKEEIRKVMSENGGVINTRALQSMVKMDSYMKEALRFNPISFSGVTRKVLKGFTLSNGQYIPASVNVEVATDAVAQDPANWSNSEPTDVFDGYRSYKLRQEGNTAAHARNQFVTSNEQNMMFGYGRHACPGRFFATAEIKMMLAILISGYDFKNEDGSTVRYQNLNLGRQSSPDASKNLVFKKAEV